MANITITKTIQGKKWTIEVVDGKIKYLYRAGYRNTTPFDRNSFVAKRIASVTGFSL